MSYFTYKRVVISCIIVFLIELGLREVGVDRQLRPSYWIEKGGNVAESCYYYTGIAAGYAYYLLCLFGRFVQEKLWRSLVDTILDLTKACFPYFNFTKFAEGMKYVVWDFWNNYYHLIIPGWIAAVIITLLIFFIVPNKYAERFKKFYIENWAGDFEQFLVPIEDE